MIMQHRADKTPYMQAPVEWLEHGILLNASADGKSGEAAHVDRWAEHFFRYQRTDAVRYLRERRIDELQVRIKAARHMKAKSAESHVRGLLVLEQAAQALDIDDWNKGRGRTPAERAAAQRALRHAEGWVALRDRMAPRSVIVMDEVDNGPWLGKGEQQ